MRVGSRMFKRKLSRDGASGDSAGTLAVLRPGQEATIAEIPDSTARAQALRFGMGGGASVLCVSVIPGGPVVLRSGRQEIAIGHGLARRIRIHQEGEALGEW